MRKRSRHQGLRSWQILFLSFFSSLFKIMVIEINNVKQLNMNIFRWIQSRKCTRQVTKFVVSGILLQGCTYVTIVSKTWGKAWRCANCSVHLEGSLNIWCLRSALMNVKELEKFEKAVGCSQHGILPGTWWWNKKVYVRTSDMAQLEKALPAEPHDLSLVPGDPHGEKR